MTTEHDADLRWMQEALSLAELAGSEGEVPVGAVLVKKGEMIGQGWNQSISLCDTSAHAEIIAIRTANKTMGTYRLPGTTLYVTLEPCMMCVGAMIHARIERLVFGAYDHKTGAAGSVFDLANTGKLNHNVEVTGGILAEPCGTILKNFFKQRR